MIEETHKENVNQLIRAKAREMVDINNKKYKFVKDGEDHNFVCPISNTCRKTIYALYLPEYNIYIKCDMQFIDIKNKIFSKLQNNKTLNLIKTNNESWWNKSDDKLESLNDILQVSKCDLYSNLVNCSCDMESVFFYFIKSEMNYAGETIYKQSIDTIKEYLDKIDILDYKDYDKILSTYIKTWECLSMERIIRNNTWIKDAGIINDSIIVDAF